MLSKFRYNFNSIQTLKSRLHGSLCHIRFGDLCLNFPYISLYFFPRTIFSSSSRLVRYTDKCMESSKHDWTLSVTATSLQFCSKNPFPSVKSFQFKNFPEAMFHENYLTSDFHTNTVISSLFAYSSKWRRKP